MTTFPLTITQTSMNQTALDWPRNMTNIYAAIREAVANKSDVLALEELALTGYEAGDEFQRTDNTRILAGLDDIAAYAKALDPNLIISIGHPWRVQMRDIPAKKGFKSERAKNPLYDRLNLPFNVQSTIMNGQILGMTAKANLYNDGRGYEKRYFNEWDMQAASDIGGIYGTVEIPLDEDGQRKTMFGRPIIHFQGKDGKSFHLAHAICEEKWVATQYDGHPYDDSRYATDSIIPTIPEYLGGKNGIVLVIPNASPPARDKIDRHVHLNRLAAQFADVVVDTDGLGSSGATFAQFGHRMIAQGDEVLSYGRRMAFSKVAADTSTVSVTPAVDKGKAHISLSRSFQDNPVHAEKAYESDPAQAWDNPSNPNRHYEEIIRYTAFWLFDYMRKGHHRGVMEALSGGADSGFNSVMVSVMVHMGIRELGVEEFCNELRLPFKADVMKAYHEGGEDAAIERCMQSFLTGVYMGTDNSSDDTINAARFLMQGGTDSKTGETVKGIGGKFVERNVQDLLDFYGVMYAVEHFETLPEDRKIELSHDIASYLNMSPYSTTREERQAKAEALKGKYPEITDLVTAADGVAYENIQARGREVLIMLFANKERKMAVANPNLDEARNAYATFGGDLHSGTINLNAHMPKAYELQVLQYLYEHGLQGVMPPVRALGPILKNKPTAELQPKDDAGNVVQHDEDALQRTFVQMDTISDHMLYTRKLTKNGERRLNAGEIYDQCRNDAAFANADENELFNMIRLSYVRWTIAQHKIHASPIGPTFGKNVDHQTSQRTPNIGAEGQDEIASLGLDIMERWAERDGLQWDKEEMAIIRKRAWQDPSFIHRFEAGIWSGTAGLDYDLGKLYRSVKQHGWDGVFPPLNDNHPIKVIYKVSPNLVA